MVIVQVADKSVILVDLEVNTFAYFYGIYLPQIPDGVAD